MWDHASVAIVMGGSTTVKYLRPCSNEETGFQGQALESAVQGGIWDLGGAILPPLARSQEDKYGYHPGVAKKGCSSSNYNY